MRINPIIGMLLVAAWSAAAEPKADPGDPNALILQIVAETKDPAAQASMLQGMLEGFEGRSHVRPPAGWPALYRKLQSSDDSKVRQIAGRLAQIFGDRSAQQKALAALKSPTVPIAERIEALRALSTQKQPALRTVLPGLLDEPAMRLEAIRAYAALEDPSAPKLLLGRYAKWPAAVRRVAVETLASRKTYARALISAIGAGKVPRSEVPAYLSRQLKRMLGAEFTEVWGPVKTVSEDKAKAIARYKSLLSEAYLAKGDAARGRVIFERTCAACHTLFDRGGKVGPDITGSNRANLDYILYQMLDPNDDVPEAYRMVVITTTDGRVLAGRVVEESPQRLVLQTTTEKKSVLKSDVRQRQVSPVSMMPEGLLNVLKDHQVRDLILYLRSDKQIPLPE